MSRPCLALGLVFALFRPAVADEPEAKPTPEQLAFFESKVRPVLADKCYSCHGAKKQSGGLRLDTAKGVKLGADYGPVIVPGDPAKSPLVAAIRRGGDAPMPPKEPLPADAGRGPHRVGPDRRAAPARRRHPGDRP